MENQNPMQGGGGQQPEQGFRREEGQSQAPEQSQPQGGDQMGDNQPQADQGSQQQQQPPVSGGAGNGRIWGIIGYIFPIIFFIPLVMDDLKNNPYSKFHANQQLVLLIAGVVVNIVGTVIPIIGWFIILPIGSIVLIVFAIMGVVHAAKEEQKPLPLIGGIEIIK